MKKKDIESHEEMLVADEEISSSHFSFLSLPQEIRNLIFTYLSPKELAINRLISNQINQEIMSEHGPRLEKFNQHLLLFSGVSQVPYPTLPNYFHQLEFLKKPFLKKQYHEIRIIQQWERSHWQLIKPTTRKELYDINTNATTLAQVQHREQLLDEIHIQIIGQMIENFLSDDSYLNLSALHLTRLPSILFTQEKWKKNWENCTRLDLQNNYLTTFPIEITFLHELQTLNFSNNQLTCLPNEIQHLKKLEVLHLCSNQLSELPKSITRLEALKHLDLRNNQLTTLPKGIHNIIFLNLKDNVLLKKRQNSL